MKLSQPIASIPFEVHQLLSRRKQLHVLGEGAVRPIRPLQDALWPETKIRTALLSESTHFFGCAGTVVQVGAAGALEPLGNNAEQFWRTWDVRQIHRFEAEGWDGIHGTATLAAACRSRGTRVCTVAARLFRQSNEWSFIGDRIDEFKVRGLSAFRASGANSVYGRVPVMVGDIGGYICWDVTRGWVPMNATDKPNLRAVAVHSDGVDRLYCAGDSGLFEYCADLGQWVLERTGAFHVFCSEQLDRDQPPMLLAAGAREIVRLENNRWNPLIRFNKLITPKAMIAARNQVTLAYQRRDDDSTYVSVLEQYSR